MTGSTPQRSLAHVALVVRDYDEAIDFYARVLGFTLVEDSSREAGKRWVVVAPSGGGASLLLARAVNDAQLSRVGNQTGGRVFLFLRTDDFHRDHLAMTERGVKFIEAPREEDYGTVAVFEDLYGTRWDLIEYKTPR
jgi:catechol 2,3-dioxygenase-like lactoylglutathione lyase family enzyme